MTKELGLISEIVFRLVTEAWNFFCSNYFRCLFRCPRKNLRASGQKNFCRTTSPRGAQSAFLGGSVAHPPRQTERGDTGGEAQTPSVPTRSSQRTSMGGSPSRSRIFFPPFVAKKKASQIPNTCPQQCTMPAYLICRALIAINFYPCTRRQHSVVTSMGFVLHSQYDPFLCRKMQKTWSEEPAASGVPVAGGPAWDRLPVQLDLEEQDGVEHERPDAAHQEGGLHPQPVRGKGRSQAPHRAVGGAGASPPQPCRCAGAALLCGPGHSQDGGSVRVRASLRDPTPSRSSTGDSKWVKGEEQWGGGMGGIDMLSVR